MCIRDRRIAADCCVAAGEELHEARAAGKRRERVGFPRIVPVSYTHLRAHETVLDLVCRLLLEKKKQLHINIRSDIENDTRYQQQKPTDRQCE